MWDYFTGRNETTKTKMTINGVYLDHGHDHDRKLKLQQYYNESMNERLYVPMSITRLK